MKKAMYDFVAIGGGSASVPGAKRARFHGKTACVIENRHWGGTCVNVGCVPKKIGWGIANANELMHQLPRFGFKGQQQALDYAEFVRLRDKYVTRLSGLYESGLESAGVDRLDGTARVLKGKSDEPISVEVTLKDGSKKVVTADKLLVAVGGTPQKCGCEGEDLCINSDGFFELKTLPKKAIVLGAGYIAIELAGILTALGVDTTMCVRRHAPLRNFDEMITRKAVEGLAEGGTKLCTDFTPKKITKDASGTLTVESTNGNKQSGDVVLCAVGRQGNVTDDLFEDGHVKVEGKKIVVDANHETSRKNVYSTGDCAVGFPELTPVAIMSTRLLLDRLYGGGKRMMNFDLVPTVIFSHPPIATMGLSEAKAREKFDDITVYESSFVNLFYAIWEAIDERPKSACKLVCQGPDEKIVGLHMVGYGCDEILQGFAVAIKMGATKADFDACIAIHPTAGEEFVTLPFWGKAFLESKKAQL